MFLKGNRITVYVSAPEILKEITLCTSLAFGRSTAWIKQRTSLLSDSVATLNGQAWAHHRKIIAPEFFMEKVKVKLLARPLQTIQNHAILGVNPIQLDK